MTHQKLIEQFKAIFPEMGAKVIEWYPTGKDCVRLRFTDYTELIFTFSGYMTWSLETVSTFTSRINVKNNKIN